MLFDELPNEIIPSRLPDFEVRGYGTIYLVRPKTAAAKDWVNEHVVDCTWFGDAIAVEHRYVDDVLIGIRLDGLEVLFGA